MICWTTLPKCYDERGVSGPYSKGRGDGLLDYVVGKIW
jgi:hypothetical protein